MSNSFIGSHIAIVTKSQSRYIGTIIGIDAQASSILLGNVQCFDTENHVGDFSDSPKVVATVPVMQFANSDIEDLKIVDDDQIVKIQQQQKPPVQPLPAAMPVLVSPPLPIRPPQRMPSIHDDPAVVSAVLSQSNNDSSISSRLAHDFHHLNLSGAKSTVFTKAEESRPGADSGEPALPWSLSPSSKLINDKSFIQQQQHSGITNRLSEFTSSTNHQQQFNHSQQQRPTQSYTNRTIHHQDDRYKEQDSGTGLPFRQAVFSNGQNHPQHQQNRYPTSVAKQQHQRYFYNNRYSQLNNQRWHSGHSNRETFYDNPNNFDNDFDFESNNRKFHKLTSEDEYKQQSELVYQPLYRLPDPSPSAEYEPIYDKKKSFFDNRTFGDTSELQVPSYDRTRSYDTFGSERNQHNHGDSMGGYRRSNFNNYRKNQRTDDFYYQRNNNEYHYRN